LDKHKHECKKGAFIYYKIVQKVQKKLETTTGNYKTTKLR